MRKIHSEEFEEIGFEVLAVMVMNNSIFWGLYDVIEGGGGLEKKTSNVKHLPTSEETSHAQTLYVTRRELRLSTLTNKNMAYQFLI
jgi:hypothetical protein